MRKGNRVELPFFRRGSGMAALLAVALFSATASLHSQESTAKIRGLPNFHPVNGHLFRGGQPSRQGFEILKAKGVQIVVDFRNAGKGAARERRMVENLGLQYVSLPWKAGGFPTAQEVQRFFAAIDQNPDKKIFIHCKHGADRTGYMIGLYRITREGWTARQAVDEMEQYGYHGLLYRHLKTRLLKLETQPAPAAASQ